MAREVVGSMSDWSGVLKDVFRQISDGSITLETLKALAEHRNPFDLEVPVLLARWQKFYADVFGISTDFSGLRVPARKKGFDRLIVVAEGMTPQRLYDTCAEFFNYWKWTDEDLDKIVQSERTPTNGSYAVWFRDVVEADKELKNLSANDLKKKDISCITLEERLLMELKYFKETENHLDIVNVTLCSGSCYSDVFVPSAYWSGGGFRVGGYGPDFAGSDLRGRQAVS